LATTERRLICEGCGQEFGCGRDDIGACWCNAEAYRLPLPAPGTGATECLCPACLRQAASGRKPSSGFVRGA
jgi:Cysteine-rich CWC